MRRSNPRITLGLHRSRHDRAILDAALDLGITNLDTAYNYAHFKSHQKLRTTAGDLMDEFEISTKVGFFPAEHGTHHSLDPTHLREAIAKSVHDLGRPPDTVLLHNPERALTGMAISAAGDHRASACETLRNSTMEGLCGRWGIASWNPHPLAEIISHDPQIASPMPDVVMIRCGMLVAGDLLDTIDAITTHYSRAETWGMSPFNGDINAIPLDKPGLRLFFDPNQPVIPLQAAFRLAFELPAVTRVAVGTNQATHLRELQDALTLQVNPKTLTLYRELLRSHHNTHPPQARSPEAER